MAQRLAYLEAVVGADVTQFRRGMRDIRNEMGFLSETVSGLSGLGRSMTFMFTTPMVALGTAAINTAASFQASMYNINAIAGLTGDELQALSKRALEFGANTRSGAQAAAEGLYTVFSAGLTDVEQAFSTMEVMTFTAEAGLADLTTTTEAGLSVMLSYGDTTEAMAWRVSNAMTQMVAVGVGSMQEFAGALGNVVPTAQGLGMSIEELMGDMAFLTQRGLSAAKAGTALNSALTALIKPTDAMKTAMHQLGAGSSQELIANFGGVNNALQALIEHADGSQESLAAMFGNIRGLRAINLFAGDVDMWNDSMQIFNDSLEGATMRAWESQMMSFSASWDKLKSAVLGASIAIGAEMFPVLQPIIDGLRDIIIGVTTMNPAMLSMGVAIAAAATAAPPLLWILTSLISTFGLLLVGVAAVGFAFQTNFLGITGNVQQAAKDIGATVSVITSMMNRFWEDVAPPNNDPFQNIDFSVLEDMGKSLTFGGGGSGQTLFDVYEKSGLLETMTWADFLAAAIEGGGYDSATGIVVPFTLNLGDGMSAAAEQMALDLQQVEMGLEGMTPEVSLTFMERFNVALDQWWPHISNILGIFTTRFTSWADNTGSRVVDNITSWFWGIDEEALFGGLQALFTGDWAWIDEQLGGGGTAIADAIAAWGVQIEMAFPQLKQSFKLLMFTMGNWIKDEGVPLLARSIGFLGGRVAVLLHDAIAAAVGFLTGEGAASTASAIGTYLEDSVATPFQEGLSEATAGTDLASNVMAGLGTGLEGQIVAGIDGINIGIITNAMGAKLAEFGDWFKTEGVLQIAHGIGYFGGQVGVLIGQALGMIAGAEGAAAAGVGAALMAEVDAGFVEAMNEQGLSGGDAVLTGVVGGIVTTLALGMTVNAFLPVGAAIGLAIKGAVLIWGWGAAALGMVKVVAVNIAAAVALYGGWGAVAGAIGTGIATAFGAIGAAAIWAVSAAGSIATAIVGALTLMTLAVVLGGITIGAGIYMILGEDFKDQARNLINSFFDTILGEDASTNWYNDMELRTRDLVGAGGGYNDPERMAVGETPLNEWSFPVENVVIDFEDSQVQMHNTPYGTEGDELAIPLVYDITPVGESFASDLASGTDFTEIIETQLMPLEEAWVAMFAPEGAMATSFSTFATTNEEGWSNSSLAAQEYFDVLETRMPVAEAAITTFATALVDNLSKVSDIFFDAAGEARTLIEKIIELSQLETLVNVDVEVTSSSGTVDGSHAGGLGRVPYDGYIAELHKGERVLTKGEVEAIDAPADMLRSGERGSNGGNTTNHITVNGVKDVDGFLREMKRRGIKIG